MRSTLSLTALAAVVALPLLAAPSDADASCRSRKTNGLLIGAAGGALLGNAIGHSGTGTVVGGLGGAAVGHEVGRKGCKTRHSYHRSSSPRRVSSSARPVRHAEPRPETRKVYYDQYGAPIPSSHYNR